MWVCVCVCAKFDPFLPVRSYFDTKRPVNFFHIATFPSPTFGPLFAFHCPLFFTKNNNLECRDVLKTVMQGITFEKARRATNRSLKMTIWCLGSDLCYDEKISARGRHYNTIRQGAPFHHCLSGRRHFNTTTRSL